MKLLARADSTDTKFPPGTPPTGAVWAGLCRGDRASMQEVWERIAKVCPAILRRTGIPAQEHEDLLQEVFLSTHSYAGRHSSQPQQLDAFLAWRARGAATSHRREMMRRGRLEVCLAQQGTPLAEPPETSIMGEDLRARIAKSIEELPPKAQTIWELRHGVMMEVKEIASQLRMKAGTVASILFRARARLLDDLTRRTCPDDMPGHLAGDLSS
jgi:RNA polymerase sigma factor (sigma-70 family)